MICAQEFVDAAEASLELVTAEAPHDDAASAAAGSSSGSQCATSAKAGSFADAGAAEGTMEAPGASVARTSAGMRKSVPAWAASSIPNGDPALSEKRRMPASSTAAYGRSGGRWGGSSCALP
jgi:hypothetical protein